MNNTTLTTTTNQPNNKIIHSHIHINPTDKVLHEKFEEKDGKVIESKLVIKTTLDKDKEVVLKYMKYDSKEVKTTRALYREYRVGSLLGSLTDGVGKYLKIVEKVEGSNTIVEIFMEYEGESLNYIMNKKDLKPGDSFKITLQLLNTLTLMEKIGIPHLDIKPQNITWNKKEDKVKLIDFGASVLSYGTTNKLKEYVDKRKLQSLLDRMQHLK